MQRSLLASAAALDGGTVEIPSRWVNGYSDDGELCNAWIKNHPPNTVLSNIYDFIDLQRVQTFVANHVRALLREIAGPWFR